MAYLNDSKHGLTQTQEINGATVTCSYRPTDLLVSQELAGQENEATAPTLDAVRRTYLGKVYCTLALSRDGAEIENGVIRDELAFGQAISYLSNGIAQNVFLRGAGQADSVSALAATYPRQYGNTGRSTVLLVFAAPKLDITRGFTISYRDTQFNLGPMRFAFSANDIQDLPALQF
ncbi:MAG TPA: hypothetical protein VF629_06290 [Hymenobacter sp.]|uniref:hypothetical protein n=1 Tax=Hymenobacter sp. TaxID=1898978 RepID=UPI002ED85ECC